LASASHSRGLQIWEPSTGKQLKRFDCGQGMPWSLGITPDGNRLVSFHGSGLIQVRETATGKVTHSFGYTANFAANFAPPFVRSYCILSPDGKSLLLGG